MTEASLTTDVSLRSSNSSSRGDTTCGGGGGQRWGVDLCDLQHQMAGLGAHLGVFATEVAVHGGAGGHLGPTQVAGLGLHLLVGQVDVLLQHVLRQVLLVARGARPRLPHCGERTGQGPAVKQQRLCSSIILLA